MRMQWLENTFTVAKTAKNRAARTLTNSAFDAHSSPFLKNLRWMSITVLISSESKQLVLESLNNQAPQYICVEVLL